MAWLQPTKEMVQRRMATDDVAGHAEFHGEAWYFTGQISTVNIGSGWLPAVGIVAPPSLEDVKQKGADYVCVYGISSHGVTKGGAIGKMLDSYIFKPDDDVIQVCAPTRPVQRLGLDSIEFYIARRQLRWLGHVSRMPYETRLPRRLLSAWVPHRRPIGSPSMTYGRSIFKALEMFRIDKTRWPELAANRSAWRETLRTGVAPPAFWPPAPPPQAKPLSRTEQRAADPSQDE